MTQRGGLGPVSVNRCRLVYDHNLSKRVGIVKVAENSSYNLISLMIELGGFQVNFK
jgi:hypothetical protein